MKKLSAILRQFILSDNGGQVLEYALIIGLIIITSLAAMVTVGTKVFGTYGSLSSIP